MTTRTVIMLRRKDRSRRSRMGRMRRMRRMRRRVVSRQAKNTDKHHCHKHHHNQFSSTKPEPATPH